MKTFILLLLACPAFAQSISFSEVIQADSVAKDELYSRANKWFVESFKDANSVLQITDKEAGQLVGKGNIPYAPTGMGSQDVKGAINFLITVTVKEGRYKYEFQDFTHSGSAYSFGNITIEEKPLTKIPNYYLKYWEDAKNQTQLRAKALIDSLNDSMSKSQNDW